jgi:glutamyl-tRNA synthetase
MTGGKLIFRNEDLDFQRCKPEFVQAMYEDLKWLGLKWDEGPNEGGPFGPYCQSLRRNAYLKAWLQLRNAGFIYPCSCTRKDLERALQAPHEDDDEVHYPGFCRSKIGTAGNWDTPAGVSWRFRVPDGETVAFHDVNFGPQSFVEGRDFTDFLIWRRDDIPAYQLAVVVDDAAMQITEVVRGADLLKSTARQLLLIRALRYSVPQYFHCPLVTDARNVRLAKRHDALSLRTMRSQGIAPEDLRRQFEREMDWRKSL